MTPELPPSPPPTFKDRRGWLIAFGIVEIVIGGFWLLMIVFFLISVLVHKTLPSSQSSPVFSAVGITMTELFYGVIAAFFITVGVGSIRRRNWARIAMVVGSILWLFWGILSAAMLAFLFPHLPRPPSVHPGSSYEIVFAVMLLVLGIFFILLPTVFLFFYTRKSVKATCLTRGTLSETAAAEAAPRKPAPPVPIIILVVLEAVGAVAVLGVLFRPVTFLFGGILHGFPAILLALFYSALAACAAWLIYQRNLAGWALALIKLGFALSSLAVSLAAHGGPVGLSRDMSPSGQELQLLGTFPQFFSALWGAVIVGLVCYFVFLLYTYKYFLRTHGEATGAP